ncbi:MAG: mechanosensitive ion channel family protein [Sandaracinaceae bacterium]|nr:mechanosensitive ion channel family protein [Sandaracinaceae bacterium]
MLDGEVPAAWLDGSIDPGDGGPPAELDAGPPDAGVAVSPDAGAPPPEPALEERDRGGMLDYGLEILDRLGMLERQQREGGKRGAVRPASESAETPEARDEDDEPSRVQIVLDDDLREWLGFDEPERRFSTFGLIVLLALCLFGVWALGRARAPLPERGLVPRALGALHLAVRLAAILLVLMLASRLLPTWLHPALRLTLAAAAVAVGFGAVWTLLPDVIGGVVLLTEGRLRPGHWVTGEGFAGTVEQLGPRVTLLRGPDGALVTVPNRIVVKTAVRASERRWHEVSVELRAPAGAPADEVRRALRDAVLSSPYVPPDPGLVLSRDPREPERWRLEVRLLDVRYAAPFEGQLLERVEEALARSSGAPGG